MLTGRAEHIFNREAKIQFNPTKTGVRRNAPDQTIPAVLQEKSEPEIGGEFNLLEGGESPHAVKYPCNPMVLTHSYIPTTG